MSIRLMTMVWDHSEAEGAALLLLLALADFGNDEGESIHPGIETLAKKCRRSYSSILRDLDRLVELNELAVERNRGRHQTNRYKVLVDNLRGKPVNLTLGGPQNMSGDRKNVSSEVGKSVRAVTEEPPILEPPIRSAEVLQPRSKEARDAALSGLALLRDGLKNPETRKRPA